MMRLLTSSVVLFSTIYLECPAVYAQEPQIADWTIMIFMNGDNNLEGDALINFRQLAEVGSSDKVNALVQFDRIAKYAHTTPDWSQTLRFRVTKGMEPLPKFALQDLGEVNMGDGRVLQDFVSWSRHQFPAKHYMLVIWDHGQGWRLLLDDLSNDLSKTPRTRPRSSDTASGAETTTPLGTIRGPGYRSISFDETNNDDRLYNSEIHDALRKALGNQTLDILGFDACVMSMVETAYAMRDVARYLVGSEELEPGTGWDYEDWFQRIGASSPQDGAALSKITVASYEDQYRIRDPETTLSAIDLSGIDTLANSIDRFSAISMTKIDTELQTLVDARTATSRYGITLETDYKLYHVDLGKFLEEVTARTKDNSVREAAIETRKLIDSVVVSNYAGAKRKGPFGSNGLAIYFPSNLFEYRTDPHAENGYEKSNKKYPVAFVSEHAWADFLHDFLMRAP